MTARQMAEQLKPKLPLHTFKAVMRRCEGLNSEDERREVLSRILWEWGRVA